MVQAYSSPVYVILFFRLQMTSQLDAATTITNITHVLGTSSNYPGNGTGVSGFWTSLISEEDLPRMVPFERWDLERYYVPEMRGDLSMYVRMASFVDELEHFDTNLFRLDASTSL